MTVLPGNPSDTQHNSINMKGGVVIRVMSLKQISPQEH